MPFQRLTSRAENLYYRQNWQLLPNAEPQPASIWGTVPDTVVKVMACVADWVRAPPGPMHRAFEIPCKHCSPALSLGIISLSDSSGVINALTHAFLPSTFQFEVALPQTRLYLQTPSQSLQPPSRMASCARHQVEPRHICLVRAPLTFKIRNRVVPFAKLSCPRNFALLTLCPIYDSNEDTPNNPVELVQQIHLLTMLNRNHFECDYIHCPPPSNLLQASIMNLRLSNILNRRMVIVSAAEMAVSTFSAVVAADRTGDLTRRLIEDSCMIEFLINIIRSSPETRNELVKASVMSLATLYVRSRTTCALVSRLLPPPLVSLLYHDQPISSVRALNACAYASYVLYPGAHAQPCPKHPDSAEPSISNAEAKDAMVARHTDLNPVMIFPQHSSEYYLIEEVTDGWSRSEPAQELPIEKETYNLNFVPYGTHSDPIGETFALALSHGNEEEHELEELLSEALVQNFKILERFETVAEEEENERDEIEEKQQEEALERGEVLEIDKHAGIGDDPFSPIALRAKAVKWAERFATADNEWHLYLSLTNSSCSTVLHRAVLKLSIDVPDDEKSEYSEVEANGYWTMAHDESLSTVVESGSAGFGPGAYGSPEDAAGSSKLFTPEWWCETHAISLTGRLDLSFGSFRAKIARESPLVANEKSAPPKRGKRKEPKKEERWQLSGQSFEYGFRGDILVVSSDNERGVVGGFLLLKADATNEMEEFGIRAYQQLAPLSVKQGPLADTPLLPIGPRDLRRDIGYEQIALTSSILVAAYSNYHAMDSLHIDGLILANRSSPFMQSFFFNDPVNEEILGPWQTLRLDFARLTSQDLEGVRGALISGFKEELSHDLEFYHSFGLPTILRLKQISNLLNPYYDLADLDFCNVQHWDVSEENWDKALLIYYKWAYRLSMFELLGSPIEKAVIFLWNYLYKNTSQLA